MSEKAPNSGEIPRPTITHDEALAEPQSQRTYLDERTAMVKANIPVWRLRGFDSETLKDGIVMDYYKDGVRKGYIEGDDLAGYHVYGPSIEKDRKVHHLNTETVKTQDEARKKLESYVEKTVAGDPRVSV